MTTFLLCALLAGAARAGQEPETKLELPQDPDAVVLALDWQGGFGPPRKSSEPYVEVRASGLVRVPARHEGAQEHRMQLSGEELRELVRFAALEQELLAWDAAAVQRAVDEAGAERMPRIADAADTVVTLALRERRVEARFNALELYVRELPSVGALQRLRAVADRLQNLMHVAMAGGKERARALLAHANEALRERHPDAAPFELGDLQYVQLEEGGVMTLAFQRAIGGEPGRDPEHHVRAEMTVPSEGDPLVKIHRE